mgnify:CR=1 FL=1
MIEKLQDEYFEALEEPKPDHAFGLLDTYRFYIAYRHLARGSVLDVGVYFCDFLDLVRRDGREIFGTEVNDTRRDLANSILGEDITVVDFRNGRLTRFKNDSIDNVVAMEVVEHVPDDNLAISELCRVARKRVIITVPFRERIRTVLCVHCNKYTPYSGHLHSYDLGDFSELVPFGWCVVKEFAYAKPLTRRASLLLPRSSKASLFILKYMDKLSPGNGNWLLCVLEPAREN